MREDVKNSFPMPRNTHSPVWPRHVQLLWAMIWPTTGACGWEIVSRDTPLTRMVRIHRVVPNKQVGGTGPRPHESMLRVHCQFLERAHKTEGWCDILIYAIKFVWQWVFAFMVVPVREMGVIACLTKAEELSVCRKISSHGDLQQCCKAMWVLLKVC